MAMESLCSISNCGKRPYRRGWCRKHYYELRVGPTCTVDGCGKPHYAHGYCNAHFQMWKKHGNPTFRLSAYGDVTAFFNLNVLTHIADTCLIWPYATAGKGYGVITIDEKKHYVHRLVCEAEHGPAPSDIHEAAHSCGNCRCVARKHLSWKTPFENEKDKLVHGTRVHGERVGTARLTEPDVREIIRLKGSMSQAKIAKCFGVSQTLVGAIHRRKLWRSIQT